MAFIRIGFRANTEGLEVNGWVLLPDDIRPLSHGWTCGYCRTGRFLIMEPGEQCLTCGAMITSVDWLFDEAHNIASVQ